jgi:hypothetical protein
MHPLIRVLSLIVFTLFMASGDWRVVGIALLSLTVAYALDRVRPDARVWFMLRRLRLFLISIVILYGFMTPGEYVLPGLDLPISHEGLLEGAIRSVNLIAIIFAVNWLMQTATRSQLVQSIYWLARPLKLLGVEPSRLALRLVLTLECVATLKELQTEQASDTPRTGSAVERIAARGSALVKQAIELSERGEPHMVDLATPSSPGVLQWLGLAVLVAALLLLTHGI